MELELKHWLSYLPYGLKCIVESRTLLMGGAYILNGKINLVSEAGNDFDTSIWTIKPILRPFSDLTKENIPQTEDSIISYLNIAKTDTWSYHPKIKSLRLNQYGKGYIQYNLKLSGYLYLPYEIVELLLKHHFDIFGLIDAGLAVDINTLSAQ